MPVFQLKLRGYGEKKSPKLLKWVLAPSQEAFNIWLFTNCIRPFIGFPTQDNLTILPECEDWPTDQLLDVQLDQNGRAYFGNGVWWYWHTQIMVHQNPPRNVWLGRWREDREVFEEDLYLNDKIVNVADSLRIVKASPDGFSWGYMGAGPMQTAAAILLTETGDVPFVLAHCDEYMRDIVSNQPRFKDGKRLKLHLTSEQVAEWIKGQGGRDHPSQP